MLTIDKTAINTDNSSYGASISRLLIGIEIQLIGTGSICAR